MELEQALYEYLKARAAAVPTLGALIGTGDQVRVYHLLIPQHAYGEATKLGCVVIGRQGTGFDDSFCGTDPLVAATIQIDSYSTDKARSDLIGRLVRNELLDYSGILAGEVPVDRITIQNDFPLLDPEPGLYRRSQSYQIWNEE